MDWASKRVMVTGGAGFLGSYVVAGLRERGCANIFVPRSAEYDLRQMSAIKRAFGDNQLWTGEENASCTSSGISRSVQL